MRLIDADQIKNIKFAISKKISVYVRGWNDAVDAIIENAPTIEAKPIKHGKWIVSGTFDDFLKCSECGYKIPWSRVSEEKWVGCPTCLAKMDGKEASENET